MEWQLKTYNHPQFADNYKKGTMGPDLQGFDPDIAEVIEVVSCFGGSFNVRLRRNGVIVDQHKALSLTEALASVINTAEPPSRELIGAFVRALRDYETEVAHANL